MRCGYWRQSGKVARRLQARTCTPPRVGLQQGSQGTLRAVTEE
jgi:hypothetical protein